MLTSLGLLVSEWMPWIDGKGMEAVGVLTTALGIWLTTRRKMACWPVVLIAEIIYLFVFYRAHLLSDSLLQIFFIAFTLYGWWHWSRGVCTDGTVRVVRMPPPNLLAGLLVGALGGLLLGALMKQLNAALPYLDAELASLSLVASWWQARKYTANWPLWILINLFYIGEYIYKSLPLTAALYAGLIVLAAMGWRSWHQAARAQSDAL